MNINKLLNEKIGLNINYECEDLEGDNGVFDSKNFTEAEVQFLVSYGITPDKFKTINETYLDNILKIIERNPYLKVYGWDDSINRIVNSEKIKQDYEMFLNNQSNILNLNSKVVLKTYLELLKLYPLEDLLDKREYITKELESGMFDVLAIDKEAITSEDREKINMLSWKKEDIENYSNLDILKQRLEYIEKNGKVKHSETEEILKYIEYIQQRGIPEPNQKNNIKGNSDVLEEEFISALMKNIYGNYERINRKDIILSSYSSNEGVQNKIPKNMLVHYYNSGSTDDVKQIFKNLVINRERFKKSQDLVTVIDEKTRRILVHEELEREYSEEIEAANLDECFDDLMPSVVFNPTDEDIENKLGYALEVFRNSSKQISCTFTSEDLLESRDGVQFAVGFDSSTLKPDSILLSTDRNADSNLGVDNIPYKNRFKELSKTYTEIMQSNDPRRETLLSRENLQVSYCLCIYDDRVITQESKRLIELEKLKAKKLNIPIVEINRRLLEKENEEIRKIN